MSTGVDRLRLARAGGLSESLDEPVAAQHLQNSFCELLVAHELFGHFPRRHRNGILLKQQPEGLLGNPVARVLRDAGHS